MCVKRISRKCKAGFSLIELIAAVSAALVLILGMGIMLAHSQRGFNEMYKRVHSSVVEDAYSARRTFDRVVRKSTFRTCDLSEDGSELRVYYYFDPEDRSIVTPDMYARFYLATGDKELKELFVEYGGRSSGQVRLARDVQMAESKGPLFSVRGRTVYMALPLDNEKEKMKMFVTSSAVRHNK